MESFGAPFEPSEPAVRTVKEALPLGMEGRSEKEIKEALGILDSLLSKFETDRKIEHADRTRFFVQKSAYAEFVKQATASGIPTRFVNSFLLETKAVKLSKPAPSVLRPKLTLTGQSENKRKPSVRVSKGATVGEQVAKTSVEPAQQDIFGFE